MSNQSERPFFSIEDEKSVEKPKPIHAQDEKPSPHHSQQPVFAEIETLEIAELANPQLETAQSNPETEIPSLRSYPKAGGWMVWSLLVGFLSLAMLGTAQWAIGLLSTFPVLGIPAVIVVAMIFFVLLGLAIQEVRALRRLHNVEEVRRAWANADGTKLRHLIMAVGERLSSSDGAHRAAEIIDDAGPVAARRIMSREVLAPRDRLAVKAVASAARQGFVMVVASPSPALDSLLLIFRAGRLLRQLAAIYGYRPGALALRSLAMAAVRDASAVAIADALTQAAAHSASDSIASAGKAVTNAGIATLATGAGAVVGLPIAAVGFAMTMLGRGVGVGGGAVGGASVAAWRLYRFGLMVLVASRPVPFGDGELTEFQAKTRSEILGLWASEGDGRQRT